MGGQRRGVLDRAMAERQRPAGWQVWLTVGLVLAGLATGLILWGGTLYRFVADQERIRNWVSGLGALAPVAVMALEMLQVLLAPIPGQAIDAVSGYLFGVWWGTLYAAIGIVAGSLLNFAIARRFGRPLLSRLVKPAALAHLDDLAEHGGALFFFLIWLFPFVPDDLACLASGLTPMSTRRFLLLVIVGRTPGILVSTWVGAQAAVISPLWWGILLAAMTLAALAIWHWGGQIQSFLLRLIDRLSNYPKP
jgi:uncharacterized membrane protein YdjX (TVP38/TMEM64 family)